MGVTVFMLQKWYSIKKLSPQMIVIFF